MNNYPELENKTSDSSVSTTSTDSKQKIKETYNSLKKQSNTIINKALSEKKKALNAQLAKIPTVYKGLRNNLTLTNNKAKRSMEEHIANTGNHTASGYAISKRMNNQNEYNKELSNINISEASEKNAIHSQLKQADYDAAAERAKIFAEYDYKELQDVLAEEKRIAEHQLNLDKFNEEKRVNDSKLRIADDENKRENEKHELEMKYEPEIYQAKLDGMYKDNALTDAKISQTKASTNKSSSSSKSSSSTTSKMSAKDVADNIIKQIGLKQYDHNGKEYYDYEELEALTFLLTWRNKFGLSDQVVNDAAIYLGIADYI